MNDAVEGANEQICMLTLISQRLPPHKKKILSHFFFFQAIESANTPGNHKVVDLFVLLILHSTANRKKAMETLIRNKIKNGHFTEEMLNAAFSSHSQVKRETCSEECIEQFSNDCRKQLRDCDCYA